MIVLTYTIVRNDSKLFKLGQALVYRYGSLVTLRNKIMLAYVVNC